MTMYLSERLKQIGTALDLEFVSRSSLLTMEKRQGGEYQAYKYKFRLNGEEIGETIFPKTHDWVLSKAQPGQICRAELDPANPKFVKWTVIPFGEGALQMPHPAGNFGSVKAERKSAEIDRSAVAHDWKLGLAGIVQAMLVRGASVSEITGGEIATELSAEGWARWIRDKADSLSLQ